MEYPNFNEEKKLSRQGYRWVVGIDEAGRGPLAGPVVASAVIMSQKLKLDINDSKKLTAKQRDCFYKILTSHPQIKWGIGIVSEKIIDKINILEATKLAMTKAVNNLRVGCKDTILIIDGNFKIENLKVAQRPIIKGDQRVFSCAAASIIAKVTRDRIMLREHKKYPQYRFDLHKGYPTALHRKIIKKIGISPIHRKTFSPVKEQILIFSGK
jgi:ribonuclease HII